MSWIRATAGSCLVALAASVAACRPPILAQQVEARRLAADLRVQFAKAADAANRAVMAGTDEAAAAAAQDAEQATQAVLRDLEGLRPILQSLGYPDALRRIDAFTTRFAEYRKLDGEILPLAVENTNLKAQRLSFGPAREASEAFRHALEAAAKSGSSRADCSVEVLVARARAALLEIQVIEARHIAEPDAAGMSDMEEQMRASEGAARGAVDALAKRLQPGGQPRLKEAVAAIDRFKTINDEIVALSRRNSNVRSLALSLGRKRVVTAECDDHLLTLQEAIAKHELSATR
jgi:hypothetical protein